jgi:hypothetical protein
MVAILVRPACDAPPYGICGRLDNRLLQVAIKRAIGAVQMKVEN